MKRFFFMSFLLLLFLPLLNVSADETTHFKNIQIDILPEFDNPEVRIVYRISLAQEVTLPAALQLYIPSGSEKSVNVVMKDTDGVFMPLSYSIVPDGQKVKVSFTTTSDEIQIEYYDSSLIKQGFQRTYKFNWSGDYFVDQMTLHILQPVNAHQMVIRPVLRIEVIDDTQNHRDVVKDYSDLVGSPHVEEDGHFYYSILLNNTYSRPLELKISYEKTDSVLSSNLLPVKLYEPGKPESIFGLTIKNIPWVTLCLGFLFIALGMWRLIESGRQYPLVSAHYDDKESGDKKVIYCQNCGKRTDPKKDEMCPSCGQKLPSP